MPKRKRGGNVATAEVEDDDDDREAEDVHERRALGAAPKAEAIVDEVGLTKCLDFEEPFLESLVLTFPDEIAAAPSDDDLAREVSIYNATLAAVAEGRRRLVEDHAERFERPEDFFCEMMKSDAHMAKVKEELIFQQKKMEAFEKRKERQHQMKFNKAVKAEKAAEKAKKKREAIRESSDFAQRKKSRKRLAADRKWGFGGRKRGKKRSDAKSIGDMTAFDPKKGKTLRKQPGPTKKRRPKT